jgi:hypothetical protein
MTDYKRWWSGEIRGPDRKRAHIYKEGGRWWVRFGENGFNEQAMDFVNRVLDRPQTKRS